MNTINFICVRDCATQHPNWMLHYSGILPVIRDCWKGCESDYNQVFHWKQVSNCIQKMYETPLGATGISHVLWFLICFWEFPAPGLAMAKIHKESIWECKQETLDCPAFQAPKPKWLLMDVKIVVPMRLRPLLNRMCRCVLGFLNSFDSPKSMRCTRLACLPTLITMLLGLRSWWTRLWEWMYCRWQSWTWKISTNQVWPWKSIYLPTGQPGAEQFSMWTKNGIEQRGPQGMGQGDQPPSHWSHLPCQTNGHEGYQFLF